MFIEEYYKEFESSSVTTPEWAKFFLTSKKYFTKTLKPIATGLMMSRGHFSFSGFFTALSGQIYYFSIADVRHFKDPLLIRTATSYEDYTGGYNQYLKIDENLAESLANLIK